MARMIPRSIVQIIHAEAGGGVETLARMINEELGRRGFDIETRVLYASSAWSAPQKLAAVAKAAWRIAKAPPEVLVAYQPTASLLVGLVGRLSGCRVRLVHQTLLPGEGKAPLRVLDRIVGALGFYSVNVVNTRATAEAFSSYPAGYRRRVRLIEHGVSRLPASGDRATTLARHAIPDGDGPLLITVGRLCPQKAQDRILQALHELPDCRLILVGSGPDEDAYRHLAHDLGVSGRVHFLGALPRDELGSLMAAADVFVFPSRWETFGLAAVEAAMAGLPLVVSDMPVLREVLSSLDERSVRFARAQDPHALAADIQSILADPLARGRAVERREAIGQRYGLDRMIDAYAELLCS